MGISIHDRNALIGQISQAHAYFKGVADQHYEKTKEVLPVFDIDKAIKSFNRRYNKHCGNTSKYKPHQGYAECERRRRRTNK